MQPWPQSADLTYSNFVDVWNTITSKPNHQKNFGLDFGRNAYGRQKVKNITFRDVTERTLRAGNKNILSSNFQAPATFHSLVLLRMYRIHVHSLADKVPPSTYAYRSVQPPRDLVFCNIIQQNTAAYSADFLWESITA